MQVWCFPEIEGFGCGFFVKLYAQAGAFREWEKWAVLLQLDWKQVRIEYELTGSHFQPGEHKSLDSQIVEKYLEKFSICVKSFMEKIVSRDEVLDKTNKERDVLTKTSENKN